jgi:hypothetical protein
MIATICLGLKPRLDRCASIAHVTTDSISHRSFAAVPPPVQGVDRNAQHFGQLGQRHYRSPVTFSMKLVLLRKARLILVDARTGELAGICLDSTRSKSCLAARVEPSADLCVSREVGSVPVRPYRSKGLMTIIGGRCH